MTNNDLRFILEMLMPADERGFLMALRAKPDDAATRNAYVDWLIEQCRPEAAELVRGGYVPTLYGESPMTANLQDFHNMQRLRDLVQRQSQELDRLQEAQDRWQPKIVPPKATLENQREVLMTSLRQQLENGKLSADSIRTQLGDLQWD